MKIIGEFDYYIDRWDFISCQISGNSSSMNSYFISKFFR